MDDALKQAVETLTRAGALVVLPGASRCYALGTVAALLDVSPTWVREHLEEFAGWFRLPGGGRNGGEIRIPASAVEQFQRRRQKPVAV